MKRSKNLLRKGAALAAMSTVLVSQAPLINAFAYGEADVSQSTFKQDTDNSADFQNWLSNVWQGGEKAYAQTENIALTPGSDAADLNFQRDISRTVQATCHFLLVVSCFCVYATARITNLALFYVICITLSTFFRKLII